MFDSPQSSPEHTPEYAQYSGPHHSASSRYGRSMQQAGTGEQAGSRREQPGVGGWQRQQAAMVASSMERSAQQGFGSSRWTQATALEFFVNKANKGSVRQQQEQLDDNKQPPYHQPTQQHYPAPTQQPQQQLEGTLPWQPSGRPQEQCMPGHNASSAAHATNMQAMLWQVRDLQDPTSSSPMQPAWQPASLQASQRSPWRPHEAAGHVHAAVPEASRYCMQDPDGSVSKGSVSTPHSGTLGAFAGTCQLPPSDSNSSSPSTGSETLQVKAHLWVQQQTPQQQVHTPDGTCLPALAGLWGSATTHVHEPGVVQQLAAQQLTVLPFAQGQGCVINSSTYQPDHSTQPAHGRLASSAAVKAQAQVQPPAITGTAEGGPILQTPWGHPGFQARGFDPSTLRQDSNSSSSSCWLGQAGSSVTRYHPQAPLQQKPLLPWAASHQATAAPGSAQLASLYKQFSPRVLSAPTNPRVPPSVPAVAGPGSDRSSAQLSVQGTSVLEPPGALGCAAPGAGNTPAQSQPHVQQLQHPYAGGVHGSSMGTRAGCMSSMAYPAAGGSGLLQGIAGPLPVLSTGYGQQHQPPVQQQQEDTPTRYTCSLDTCCTATQLPTPRGDIGAAVSPNSIPNQLPADAAPGLLRPATDLSVSQHSLQVATPAAASSLPGPFGPTNTLPGLGPAPAAGSMAACKQEPAAQTLPAGSESCAYGPHEPAAPVAVCHPPPAANCPAPAHAAATGRQQGPSTAVAGHATAEEESEDAWAGLDSLLPGDTRDHVADLFEWAEDGADILDLFDEGCL